MTWKTVSVYPFRSFHNRTRKGGNGLKLLVFLYHCPLALPQTPDFPTQKSPSAITWDEAHNEPHLHKAHNNDNVDTYYV